MERTVIEKSKMILAKKKQSRILGHKPLVKTICVCIKATVLNVSSSTTSILTEQLCILHITEWYHWIACKKILLMMFVYVQDACIRSYEWFLSHTYAKRVLAKLYIY